MTEVTAAPVRCPAEADCTMAESRRVREPAVLQVNLAKSSTHAGPVFHRLNQGGCETASSAL